MPNTTVVRFARIFKNLSLMLEARGYYTAHDWTVTTPEQFEAKVGSTVEDIEDYVLIASKVGDLDEKLCVLFPQERVNKVLFMSLRQKAKANGCSQIILCSKVDMTSATRSLMNADPDYNIEYFMYWKFLINLPEHDFVPQHVILTGTGRRLLGQHFGYLSSPRRMLFMADSEKAALLQRYKVHEMQLPRIKLEDPISKYYAMKRGQVVKIIRRGGVNGRHVTYRVVN